MKKAIGYIRVSTEKQASEGVSLDAQRAKIEAWCLLNEYELVSIHEDAGVSGKRADNRNGLQAALDDITEDTALVVYSLSRLARSTKDTIEIAERIEKTGGDLVSLSEKIDTTTAAGKMVFRMLAVLNEFERDQVSDRTKAALSHKKANGEKTGGDVPFGFDNREGHLIENKNERKAIKLIKDMRADGITLKEIASELERRGITTKRGKIKWHPQTISRIAKRTA